jgi:hypothetical protein
MKGLSNLSGIFSGIKKKDKVIRIKPAVRTTDKVVCALDIASPYRA